MFQARTFVPIIASAVLLSAAVVVPALAVTQAGPFYVPDTSNPYAIQGNHAGIGTGVLGTSAGGIGVSGNGYSRGVTGLSAYQFGVVGTTQTSSTSARYAGVAGLDHSTAGFHYGVYGASPTTGIAGFGTGMSAIGVIGQGTADGVVGTATSASGISVYGTSNIAATGVFGSSYGGIGVRAAARGSSSAVSLLAETDGVAIPMEVWNDGGPGPIMSVDNAGNMIIRGTLTQSGTPLAVVRGSGPARVAYGAQMTAPAIEDAGEGRINGGIGYVTIDPAFASTLDARVPYSVYITPEGDSHGLYVTGKSQRGFFVRESAFGRSSIAFAYRILGKPASANSPRLPLYTDSLKLLPRPRAQALPVPVR